MKRICTYNNFKAKAETWKINVSLYYMKCFIKK